MKKLYMDLRAVLNTLICMIVNMLPGKKVDVFGLGKSNAVVFKRNGITIGNSLISGNRSIYGRGIDYEKIYRSKRCHLFDKSGRKSTMGNKTNPDKFFSNQLFCPGRAPCREQDRCLFSVHNINCFDI